MPLENTVAIGCCGWSSQHWADHFGPPGAQPDHDLEIYARHFPIVEVDSTFHSIPSRARVESWVEMTPNDFRFSLLLSKTITHARKLQDCDREVQLFVAAIDPLGHRLHSVCAQLDAFGPESFRGLGQFLDVLEPFLETWPHSIPLSLEVRNRDWIAPPLTACLKRHGTVLVLSELAGMPSPAEVARRLDPVTGSFAYFRLLGSPQGAEKIASALDRAESIRQTAKLIRQLSRRVPVLVSIDDRYAGHGPSAARRLRALLEDAEERRAEAGTAP